MNRRTQAGVLFAASAAFLVVSSAAWACTAFTSLKGPASGPAESRIQMTGESLVRSSPANRAVELRWNSLTGPVLAEVQAEVNGSISTEVSVPAALPGVYYVVAIVEGRAVARSAFEVTAPPGSVQASNTPSPQPSLRGSDRPGTLSTHDSTSGLARGAAFLAIGMVVLVAGCGVAVGRSSRRAPSGVDLTQ